MVEWIMIIEKNWNKNFEYQIVHTIWLRFFRPYVPMNILLGWYLSVSLFVCVFFLYVFVCLCVFALSLRFLNRTNVRKIFLGTHDFCLPLCLFIYLCLFISLCLFIFLSFIPLQYFCMYLVLFSSLSVSVFVYSSVFYFLSEDSSWRIFISISVCLYISLSDCLSLCLFVYLPVSLIFLSQDSFWEIFVCLSACLSLCLFILFDPKTNCSLSSSDVTNR